MQKLIIVGIGGFIGCCLRYLISSYFSKILGTQFPYGTLIVNIIGGILIGFVMDYSIKPDVVSPSIKLFLTTGLMGGLTTFSTFSYETINLFYLGNYLLGTINISLNLILSLVGVILGKFVSKLL
ncbi:fluoride efflux transporter CrcB [Lutispora thermophila]|uniref:Fluoride-specific ion channel FluC n=1 Tax=Lutispora thermophila DSM 19022 TaxID=1122184 RepID=A0A1M6EVI8_9FIRM|nr:fluoride efflux transporter CrcB [Lutispora thermophila]SHI89497.1 CrcB protein [Lutispora thermophila DSM 19022]